MKTGRPRLVVIYVFILFVGTSILFQNGFRAAEQHSLKRLSSNPPILHPWALNGNKVAVMVQSNVTTNLIPVVSLFLVYLPEDWRFQIFGTPEVRTYIRESPLGRFVDSGKITLSTLQQPPYSSNEYSALLGTRAFWEGIIAEKILIFQLDSILCSASSYHVDDFLDYDYVGAPWSHNRTGKIRLPRNGGNGGLSIRTRSKTLRVLDKFPYSKGPEDVHFTRYLPQVGGRVANRSVAEKFAVEGTYYIGSAGVHAPWLTSPSISPRRAEFKRELEKFCPEFKMNHRYKGRLKKPGNATNEDVTYPVLNMPGGGKNESSVASVSILEERTPPIQPQSVTQSFTLEG